VQAGPAALTVRRIGYTAKTISIDVPQAGVAAPVEVELEEIPSDIASVIVESSKQHLEQFYRRKATNNFGKFFERKDIQKRQSDLSQRDGQYRIRREHLIYRSWQPDFAPWLPAHGLGGWHARARCRIGRRGEARRYRRNGSVSV